MACDIKPELLEDMPDLGKHDAVATNGTTITHTCTENITNADAEQSDESNLEKTPAATEQIKVAMGEGKPQKPANGESIGYICSYPCLIKCSPAGAVDSLDESTLSEDSLEPSTPIIANEETNDSDSHSSAKR